LLSSFNSLANCSAVVRKARLTQIKASSALFYPLVTGLGKRAGATNRVEFTGLVGKP
jgi:hypothetical protein